MKKFISAMMACALCVSLAACGGSSSTASSAASGAAAAPASKDDYHIEIKLSHVFAPGEQITVTMDEIADNIREKTNGAVDIQTYNNSQLAVYKDGVEQVVRGANFISVEDLSYLGDYVPDFNILAGPMLVTSFDEYEYLIASDEVKEMCAAAEAKGIKILNLDYIFGFRSMKTNKLIETPADLKGMKIRTPGSQLYVDTLNHMGATATPMGFGETISAVQQGVVDGLEGTIDGYDADGSAEVAKKMALTKHLLGVCGAYISVDVFNSMPEEYQTIVQDEFNEGAKRMVQRVTEGEAATRERLEKDYGVTFNEVDIAAFQELVAPIYDNMANVTPGRYERFKEIIASMPK